MLRDDPYTPSEGPAPRTRRQHRRDLPAKVRRRQAFGLGAVVLAVLVGGVILIGGIGGGGGDEDQGTPIKRLVGQSFVGRIGAGGATPELLKKVRKGQLGGIFVSQELSDEAAVQTAVDQLQQAASDGDNPPLLVMIDQEGDPIRTLQGPPDIPAQELGSRADPEVARTEGDKTGAFLKPLGINVNLAPVLDVQLSQTADTIADRTFGEDAALVGGLGAAFIEGQQAQNVAATAKHFPGLGPATINTDFAPVTVVGREDELQAALEPFQAAVDAGVDLVMMSSAAYPEYAGATPGEGKVKPAVFAEPIVTGMLRGDLGFDGLIITDDLESIAIKTLTNRDVAAVAALGAGCDLVLYARSLPGVTRGFNRVVRAVKQGKLDQAAIQQSYDRITRLKGEIASAS
jgi:beta-N-acetylhexosaminidase